VIKKKDNFDDREAFRAANKDAADLSIRKQHRPKSGKSIKKKHKRTETWAVGDPIHTIIEPTKAEALAQELISIKSRCLSQKSLRTAVKTTSYNRYQAITRANHGRSSSVMH